MKVQRDEQRGLWRRQHPHSNGRRGAPFPRDLCEFPSFSTWLEADIESALAAGDQVLDIVKDVSVPPKFECRKFKSMWAFGHGFRVASYKKNLSTQDCGIAATFS